VEQELRYEIDSSHTYVNGIREDMSLDHCLHSIFGASKVAADIMVQEYGRYFQMPTACFRGEL
jgi:CDP-paratose 2-epimerase